LAAVSSDEPPLAGADGPAPLLKPQKERAGKANT